MSHLVDVIVHHLANVHEAALVHLDLTPIVELEPRSMEDSQIPQVVLPVDGAHHELRLPELLVVWNVVVARLSIADLADCSITFEDHFRSFELLRVHLFELQHQSLRWDLLGLQLRRPPLQITSELPNDILELDLSEHRVLRLHPEELKLRSRLNGK